jgi:Protein of unknown function (DUF4232)
MTTSEDRLRRLLRSEAERHQPSADGKQKIRARIEARRRARLFRRIAFAAVAAAVAAIVVPLATFNGKPVAGRVHTIAPASPGPSTTPSTTTPSTVPSTTIAPATTAPTTSPSTAPSPTTTVPSTTVPPTTTTTTLPNTTTTAIPMCGSADVAVSIGQGSAAGGHVGVPLIFRNQGAGPCQLTGYPEVAALNSSGAQAVQAQPTLSGYLGGLALGQTVPPTVVLDPGQSASALVESTDTPTGNTMTCPEYPSLLVTPPNTAHGVVLSLGTTPIWDCSTIEVHPVVPGTTGQGPGF